MFINLHTHRLPAENEWCLQNRHDHFDGLLPQYRYSMGIHPCFIKIESVHDELEKMKLSSQHSNVFAIGECGLDRLAAVDFKLQTKIFIEQILWANVIAKPLIIHCVRAFPEVLSLLQTYNKTSPVIFHGFNKQEELANELIKKGYFLSFGKSLFNPHTESVFSGLPLEQIFLETDDSHFAITDIYYKASLIKNIPADNINRQCRKNLESIFKPAVAL